MRAKLSYFFILSTIAVWISCSGGQGSINTNTGTFTTAPTKPSVVQVTIGDDPSDRVASLSLTINAVTLVNDTGTQVPLLSAPVTVEITSLAGTTSPLGSTSVPAGTYTKAAITLGGATITAVDPTTGTTVQKTFPAPASAFTLTLNPAFVSDGTALVMNVNLDLHKSIAIDGTTGALTFNPFLLVAHGKLQGPVAGAPLNPFTGGIEHVFGKVTNINGSAFTVLTAIGQRSLTFNTNSSTEFRNVSGVSGLQTGMLVMVNGQTQSDGSLLALGVNLVNGLTNAVGVTGVVAKTVGSPVTQFQMYGFGMSGVMMGSAPGFGSLVSVTNTTVFRADIENVDMTGLTLTFDASSLSPGQMVEVDTTSPPVGITGVIGGLSGISIGASQVQLVQQPLAGTISNLNGNIFTLTLPVDGAFATLTETTTVTVYKQGGTAMDGTTALANGQKVVVRGLLFNNSGYQMVATRIGVLP